MYLYQHKKRKYRASRTVCLPIGGLINADDSNEQDIQRRNGRTSQAFGMMYCLALCCILFYCFAKLYRRE